jgi:hypothetical protein
MSGLAESSSRSHSTSAAVVSFSCPIRARARADTAVTAAAGYSARSPGRWHEGTRAFGLTFLIFQTVPGFALMRLLSRCRGVADRGGGRSAGDEPFGGLAGDAGDEVEVLVAVQHG